MLSRINRKFKRDGMFSLIIASLRIILTKCVSIPSSFILKSNGLKIIKDTANIQARLGGVHANIGCGSYLIRGFINVDYFSERYYGDGKFNRIHYDMRSDILPFDDNSLDTIFCSHVIEHIETEHVIKFIEESYRVLKAGGVLRITCPDPEYLYFQLQNHPEYFSWHPLYKSKSDALLCFVDEVATPKIKLDNFGLDGKVDKYSYEELLIELRQGLFFNQETPQEHINNWDFKRLNEIAKSIGYTVAEKSRYQGSFCAALRGNDMDLCNPAMSLYVDIMK